MRVLILHNRYQQAGGEDVVVHSESALLEAHGHPVSRFEVNNDSINGAWSRAQAAGSAVYSFSSRRAVRAEIRRFRPDVVHVHNFFPLLSPAVYDACREANIPVVQTLHNYRLACPNALLFREGRICVDCLGRSVPLPGIVRGCYRGSRLQSATTAAMIAAHRLRGTWRRVDAYIALTAYQKTLMSKAGLPTDRIHVKPNFTFDPGPRCPTPGNYILFVGRLSREKGVSTLIQAYQQYGLTMPLKIVGDGPQRAEWQNQAVGPIEFMGLKDKVDVLSLMRGARFLAFPSVWLEPFGMAIIEAFSCGVPVLASRLGSLPELIHDRGWLADPGDPSAWSAAMQEAWNTPDLPQRGQKARLAYEATYSPQSNYQQLRGIYESVLRA